MKVELYIKPTESPVAVIEDTDMRLYYNNQWVDFRYGKIRITTDSPSNLTPDLYKCPGCGTPVEHHDQAECGVCGCVWD